MLGRITLGTWLLISVSGTFLVVLAAALAEAGSAMGFAALPVAAVTAVMVFRWLRPKWDQRMSAPAPADRFAIAGWSAALGMAVVAPVLESLGDGAMVSSIGLACGFLLGATSARLASEVGTPVGSPE